MDVLIRALLLACLLGALPGCNASIGDPGVWVPIDTVAGPLAPEDRALPAGVPRMAANPLRVVTFNVQLGANVDGIAAALAGNDNLAHADVFLLQEEESYQEESAARAVRLADALDLGCTYVPAREVGDGTHGLAILSRVPVDNVEVMDLPDSSIANPRIALRADVHVAGSTLRIIDLHLGAMLNITDRILQMRPAVLHAADTVLVAGDFNSNPYVWDDGKVPVVPVSVVAGADQGPILDDYMRTLDYDTPTAGVGPTEHMYGVSSRLDAIYTRGLQVTPGQVERNMDVSDHWPLWVDVTLP